MGNFPGKADPRIEGNTQLLASFDFPFMANGLMAFGLCTFQIPQQFLSKLYSH